jgi:uncharacterized protein YbcC (UPF0753/DUF2309 family)
MSDRNPVHPGSPPHFKDAALDQLKDAIEHAAHLLPSQGPITVFVHHNTLHAFEDQPFDEGVRAGGKVFHCNPYLPEDHYRMQLERGRIRVRDLEAVLLDDLGDEADRLVATFGTRYALRLAMLQFPLRSGSAAELRWTVAETLALRRFREEVDHSVRDANVEQTRHWVMRDLRNGEPQNGQTSEIVNGLIDQFGRPSVESWSDRKREAFTLQLLWRACRANVCNIQPPGNEDSSLALRAEIRRHRDVLLDVTNVDSDTLVHETLIPLCAAFLDQGFANSTLPDRQAGLFREFLNLYSHGFAPTRWLRRLKAEARRLAAAATTPLDSIAESLNQLGVTAEERDEFIVQTLLALRGYAGMVWQMETNAEWAPSPAPTGSLIEFLAVRLVLDRLAIQQVSDESLKFDGPLADVRSLAQNRVVAAENDSVDARAFLVFQLAQIRGWKPGELFGLSPQ